MSEQQIQEIIETKYMPVIPLRGVTLLPGVLFHFDAGRDITMKAVKAAMKKDQFVVIVSQKDGSVEEPSSDDFHQVGTVATVKQIVRLSGKTMRVIVSGIQRAYVEGITSEDGYLSAHVTPFAETEVPSWNSIELEAILRSIKELFQLYYKARLECTFAQGN